MVSNEQMRELEGEILPEQLFLQHTLLPSLSAHLKFSSTLRLYSPDCSHCPSIKNLFVAGIAGQRSLI